MAESACLTAAVCKTVSVAKPDRLLRLGFNAAAGRRQLVRFTIPLLVHVGIMTESARLTAEACKTACVAEPDKPLRGSVPPCGWWQ
jgi:hypothetical protein